MIARTQLKAEIDQLDEKYLDLVFNIICQFPHVQKKEKSTLSQGQKMVKMLQDIADNGGLGIKDPIAWQREMRQDRKLPFRNG
jgi:hypothetical protein